MSYANFRADPRSQRSAELVVASARKCYAGVGRTVCALDEVSFEVAQGEVCLIIGTNGSGKSTLLQAVAGRLALDRGSITLDKRHVASIKRPVLGRLRGMLYQQPLRNLCAEFSIAEMVALYGDGLDDASFSELFLSLERIGVGRDRIVNTLSGGQQQIVALELVLARRPNLILLDEPTAALDVENAALVRNRVVDAASMGVSVMFVSHDIDEALALADKLIFLHCGRLIKQWYGPELSALTADELRDFVRATAGGPMSAAAATE